MRRTKTSFSHELLPSGPQILDKSEVFQEPSHIYDSYNMSHTIEIIWCWKSKSNLRWDNLIERFLSRPKIEFGRCWSPKPITDFELALRHFITHQMTYRFNSDFGLFFIVFWDFQKKLRYFSMGIFMACLWLVVFDPLLAHGL